MTWMPNKSLFDSVAALELDQLAVALEEAEAVFETLAFALGPEESRVPPPLRMMWRGYEAALAGYVAAATAALVGYGVVAGDRALRAAQTIKQIRLEEDLPLVMPPWFEDLDVLRSHRSNLMRRWPTSYAWKGTPERMPYLWPIVDDEGGYKLKLSKHDIGLIASGDRVLSKSIAGRIDK